MTECLSRLTPSAGGLDRDALLFAAGRRSARSRLWPAVAGLLLLSQAVTLVALWPRAPVSNDSARPPLAVAPLAEPILSPASPPADVLTARSQPEMVLAGGSPAGAQFVSTGPTLTVGSVLRFD